MKEYSKKSVGRFAAACLVASVIGVAFTLKMISAEEPMRPYAFGIAVTLFVLGAALILRTKLSTSAIKIWLIISTCLFAVSIIANLSNHYSSVFIYVLALSAILTSVFIVTSAPLNSAERTVLRTNANIAARAVLVLLVLFVIANVGAGKREFIPDYLWIAFLFGVAALSAREAIIRMRVGKEV